MKTIKSFNQVIEKLKECDIDVYPYKENNKLCGYELNTYTNAGVNQLLFIDFRHSEMNPKNAKHFIKLFNERINDIDINEEMKVHSEDKRYMQNIGYEVGIQDFKDWKASLQNIFSTQNKKTPQQRQFEQVVQELDSLLFEFSNTLALMPFKGNSAKECQKTNLINHLNALQSCVNGIELKDFTPNEFSPDFKLSYS